MKKVLLFGLTVFFLFVSFSQLNAQAPIWSGTFTHEELNLEHFTIVSGNPNISDAYSDEYNHNYSLKLKARDVIESKKFPIGDYTNLLLQVSCLTRNTEPEDYLIIEVKINDKWHRALEIQERFYEETSVSNLFPEKDFQFSLPQSTDSLVLRISNTCDEDFEAWYLEQLKLYAAPEIEFSLNPDPFHLEGKIFERNAGELSLKSKTEYRFYYYLEYEPDPGSSETRVAVLGHHKIEYLGELWQIAQAIENCDGGIAPVDTINTYYQTPSVTELAQYDALLICPKQFYQYNETLGDTLIKYMKNEKGGVVLTLLALNNPNQYLFDYYYFVIHPGLEARREIDTLMEMESGFIFAHPVSKHISYISTEPDKRNYATELESRGIQILNWSNNAPLAAITTSYDARRVDLNIDPGMYLDEPQDVFKLCANSLKWAAQRPNLPNSLFSQAQGQTRETNIGIGFMPNFLNSEKSYSGKIHIYSNVLANPDTSFPVSFHLFHPDFDFTTRANSRFSANSPDSTAWHEMRITNIGKLSDSYDLSVIQSNFQISFWDSSATQSITQTQEQTPGSTCQYKIKVKIPDDADAGTIDTLKVVVTSYGESTLGDTLIFFTNVLRQQNEIPWIENFSSSILNEGKWSAENTTAKITNWICKIVENEKLTSQEIWLENQNRAQLVYFIYTNDTTNSENKLIVEGFDGTTWHTLASHQALPEFFGEFKINRISLNSQFLTNSFRIRFRNISVSECTWFLDSIKLIIPPQITYTTIPEDLNFIGNRLEPTTGEIIVTNTGGYKFDFQLDIVDALPDSVNGLQKLSSNQIRKQISVMKNRWEACQKQNSETNHNLLFQKSTASLSVNEVIQYEQNSSAATDYNVAILGCEYLTDVFEKINQTNTFASVTAINARVFLPTLDELKMFDAVFAYSGLNFGFYFPDSLGNRLADYLESGGGVVLGGHVFDNTANFAIEGRFATKEYYLIQGGSNNNENYDSMAIVDSLHVIFQNVNYFQGNYNCYGIAFDDLHDNAKIIGNWKSSHYSAVVIGEFNGARRVDLGFLPYSSDVAPLDGWLVESDGAQLMANALAWAAEGELIETPPEIPNEPIFPKILKLSDSQQTLQPGEFISIPLAFDISDLPLNQTFKGFILFKNQEFRDTDSLAVSLRTEPANYFYIVEPYLTNNYGLPGQRVQYGFRLQNQGEKNDDYSFLILPGKWPVSIWDAGLTHKLTSLTAITPDSLASFVVAVDIPDSLAWNQVDSLQFTISSLGNPARQFQYTLKTTTGWFDEFLTTVIDTTRWRRVRGNTRISSYADNEISSPYSLQISENSAIETVPVDFSINKDHEIYLKYFYKNYNTELGDDLIILFHTEQYWMEVQRLSGAIDDSNFFCVDSIRISKEYLHEKFKVKFETEFSRSAYWYLDDVAFVDKTQMIKPPPTEPLETEGTPLVYALHANYPNPFNPQTRIKYSLADAGHVKITVFNVLGQIAGVLVDKNQLAGKYQINWDAGEIAAGLYFCVFEVNNFRAVRKMILLK